MFTKAQTPYLPSFNLVSRFHTFKYCGLADAKEYDEKYEKWDLKDLPILPGQWKQTVNPGKLKQFHTVKALMSRSDVDVIICATDAGREGESLRPVMDQQHGRFRYFRRFPQPSAQPEL